MREARVVSGVLMPPYEIGQLVEKSGRTMSLQCLEPVVIHIKMPLMSCVKIQGGYERGMEVETSPIGRGIRHTPEILHIFICSISKSTTSFCTHKFRGFHTLNTSPNVRSGYAMRDCPFFPKFFRQTFDEGQERWKLAPDECKRWDVECPTSEGQS